MIDMGIVGFILILVNFAFSYRGFTNEHFFDGYKFEVDPILLKKDYVRLISSGFLHGSWTHLIFNMLSLYCFIGTIEAYLGIFWTVLIYFGSLVGGNLLALYVHRNHGNYSAIGASGAVSGVIFASIALFPGIGIGFFGLPIYMPSWLYGLIYIGFTIYGIKSQKDNIGHEAHLGGALIGMILAIAIRPNSLIVNYIPILIILIPTFIFLLTMVNKPHLLLLSQASSKPNNHYDIDHQYNAIRKNKEQELDELLAKISKKGINSLSKKEKERLDELSK